MPAVHRLLLAAVALSACHAGGAEVIPFDDSAAQQIIAWANGPPAKLPQAWRASAAHQLTKKWARWSGRPDPDLATLGMLREIQQTRRRKPKARFLRQARRLLRQVMARRQAFLRRALPHLRAYLPAGTPIRGRVLLATFIPPFAFSWGDGSVVLSLTTGYWGGSADKLLNLLVHELYHNGFHVHLQGKSPAKAKSGEQLVPIILWQIHNEGMATYVAYRARTKGLQVQDYRLLEDPAAVRQRFAMLRQLLARAAAAKPEQLPAVKKQLWQVGAMQRAFYVAGAHMARAIEQRQGRAALLRTIRHGSRAFLQAYLKTAPPAALRLPRY